MKQELSKLIEFLYSNLGNSGCLSGERVAKYTKRYFNLSDTTRAYEAINKIIEELGIEREENSDLKKEGQTILLVPPMFKTIDPGTNRAVLVSGLSKSLRKVSIDLHEIAHILASFLFQKINQNAVVDSSTEEKFAWDFALEFNCPRQLRKEWNLYSINKLLPQNRVQLELLNKLPKQIRRFSYYHLRALAASSHLSIRNTIRALNRHPVLDKASIGIAVFKYFSNRFSGLRPGLRIWQSAQPSWGYVIKNQNAIKQGFEGAILAYNNNSNLMTSVRDKELLMLNNRYTEGKKKWKTVEIKTTCAYTAIDVKDEGRYIIGIWYWPQYP